MEELKRCRLRCPSRLLRENVGVTAKTAQQLVSAGSRPGYRCKGARDDVVTAKPEI
jgi:methylphosphotriester-DNA--protein-cysteine methyltransferase